MVVLSQCHVYKFLKRKNNFFSSSHQKMAFEWKKKKIIVRCLAPSGKYGFQVRGVFCIQLNFNCFLSQLIKILPFYGYSKKIKGSDRKFKKKKNAWTARYELGTPFFLSLKPCLQRHLYRVTNNHV